MMWSPMVVGFVAAALGGIDHPGRALIAGLGLGLAERTAYLVLAPEWVPAARWAGLALALALARR
jgi:branched-subunit amino acid ABC-type transport system permease component